MTFPQTRLTFVERLAAGGSEDDWRSFMQDYWSPICRFALRCGAGSLDDAEDVASQTFEVLWENRLLARWAASRSARFRSLLCGVVRKILCGTFRAAASCAALPATARLSRQWPFHPTGDLSCPAATTIPFASGKCPRTSCRPRRMVRRAGDPFSPPPKAPGKRVG